MAMKHFLEVVGYTVFSIIVLFLLGVMVKEGYTSTKRLYAEAVEVEGLEGRVETLGKDYKGLKAEADRLEVLVQVLKVKIESNKARRKEAVEVEPAPTAEVILKSPHPSQVQSYLQRRRRVQRARRVETFGPPRTLVKQQPKEFRYGKPDTGRIIDYGTFSMS